MTINVTILVVLLNRGMLGSGVKSFQNRILPSGSICCYKRFLRTNVDRMVNYLAGSKADQVEILIGCVDA